MAGEAELLAHIESGAGIDEPTASFWLNTVVAAIVELITSGEAVEVPGLGAFAPATASVGQPTPQEGPNAPEVAGGAPMAEAPGALLSERQINFIPDEQLIIASTGPAT